MKTNAVAMLLLLPLLAGLALAAVPDAARKPTSPSSAASDGTATTTLGAKKLATAGQCSGAVAFSGTGLKADAAPGKPLVSRTTLLDKGVGWKPEEGVFVCYCPGTYQFAFAGDNTNLVLKRRPATGSTWAPIVTGSHHVVNLEVALGESLGVFLETGHLKAGSDATFSFSGFRIAKTQ